MEQIIEVLKQFIKPELLILVPVLYFIGMGLKKSEVFKDKFIPLLLGVVGMVLSAIYVLATSTFLATQDIFMAIFVAITQGILVAGASVYINQIIKQAKKKE